MSNKKPIESVEISEDCYSLRVFKDFLQQQVVVENGATEARGSACVTRSNNETYPVDSAEFIAEVVMTIWMKLQGKQCPRQFQISLLRKLTSEIEAECRNAKRCDFIVGDDSSLESQPQYDLMKLQKYVVNNLEKLLIRLTDNAEAGNLKNYLDSGLLCDTGACQCDTSAPSNQSMQHVVGHIKNKPRKMEDRHVCLDRFGEMYELKGSYSFYGVFDGHSGPLAASYAVSQLPYLMAKNLKSVDYANEDTYRDAFESAFLQADKMFAQKRISSGTTAVCALITQHSPAHLYVAWVGDSKALLVSVHANLQIVKPHKPDSPDERRRIESLGTGGNKDETSGCGAVMFVQGQWRVNGILNVSRSIGDFSVSAVIAEPDFVDIALTSSHDFLVMATDGLWDYVEEDAIVDIVYAALSDAEQKIEDIPRLLIDMAKEADSQDNITVVIVLLQPRAVIVEHFRSK